MIDQRVVNSFLSPAMMATAYSSGKWRIARHLAVIDYEFRQLIENDTADILIVRAPVRHGKSEYLSRWAAAWFKLRRPSSNLIITTHTAGLAKNHSKWVRDTVHRLAPLINLKGIDPVHSTAVDWQMEGQGMGGCLSAGVGGAIVGRGADLLLIDDYVKNHKEAASELVRDNIWDWFLTAATTRLSPSGKVVLLCTQWHEDDLIGRIIKRKDDLGLRVRSITLQAIRDSSTGVRDPLNRKDGEALWPEVWPVEKLLARKKLLTDYWWSAIYQGRPGKHGSNEWPSHYFENIWCHENEWPETFQLSAVYLDPSKGKEAKKGDYQALVFAGYRDGKVYIDSQIDRRPIPELMRNMALFCKAARPVITAIEGNAFQDLLAPYYVQACEDVDYAITEPHLIFNMVSKLWRIQRLGSWLKNRELVFRRTTSNELLVSQLKEFPNATHDDGPDGLEGALRVLCTLVDELYGREEPETMFERLST